jgi:flagella basal body P-ring formation protein FlgA
MAALSSPLARSARLLLGLAALAAPAAAETVVNVTGRTLHVVDLDPRAPADVADIELGRTPPPGGSRQFTKQEISDLVRAAGGDPSHLSLPRTLRVTTTAERWAPVELAARADSAVRAQLPPGVTLKKISAPQGVVVPPGTIVASVRLSMAKRVGRQELTTIAELHADDEIVARAPIRVVLEVSEEALAPAIRKGDRLTLVVDQGNARVGANAIALADANTGDAIFFKVTSTGKVLKARVASRDIGVVVDL